MLIQRYSPSERISGHVGLDFELRQQVHAKQMRMARSYWNNLLKYFITVNKLYEIVWNVSRKKPLRYMLIQRYSPSERISGHVGLDFELRQQVHAKQMRMARSYWNNLLKYFITVNKLYENYELHQNCHFL